MRCPLVVLLCALSAALPAAARQPDASAQYRLAAGALTQAVDIDGRHTEAAWATAAVARDFVQQRPVSGAPASFPSEVRVLYDRDALYVAARLRDPRPDSIIAQLARRDVAVSSDWFWVFLDTFHDRRNAFGFGVNAAGVQRDVRITEDTREDGSWDAVWEAGVQRDDEGWSVEMRIPLSQLRYLPDRTADWGLNFRREIARLDEVATWAPSDQGSARFVSGFGTLAVSSPLPLKRDVEITPYIVSRAEHTPGEVLDPWRGQVSTHLSTGVDLRMGIAGGLNLTATLNPDFGQVDADPAQLNLSAFETFLAERRPFFVEGGEVFQLAHPTSPKLFHSRRIGRAPQGAVPDEAAYTEPAASTRILGAAKVTGRTRNAWTVGLLYAAAAQEERGYARADLSSGRATVEPATHYAVARIARAFAEGRSSIGGMVTAARRDIDHASLRMLHSDAWTGGLDARHQFAGNRWEVAGSLIASHVRGDTLSLQRTQRAAGRRFHRTDADHVTYDPAATSLTGVGGTLRLRTLGASPWRFSMDTWARSPGLELNDVGFQHANGADAWGGYGDLTYRRLQPAGPFRRWSLGLNAFLNATFGGEIWERGGGVNFDAQLHGLWTAFVNIGGNLPTVSPEALRGGPALRQSPRTGVYVEVGADPRGTFGGSVAANLHRQLETGSVGGFIEPTFTLRPSARATVSVSGTLQRSRSPDHYIARVITSDATPSYIVGELEQRLHAASLRVDYTFTRALSVQLWAQPFIATGRVDAFRELHNARAPRFADRFRTLPPDLVERDETTGTIRVDRDGEAYSFREPDFAMRELHSTLVMRWEYRAGSTAYLVWTHDRSGGGAHSFGLRDELRQLLHLPAANRLLLKLTYRIGA